MSSKILILLLFAYFSLSKGNSSNTGDHDDSDKTKEVWDGFVATYPSESNEGWFDLPRNLTIAKKNGWTETKGASPSPRIIAMGYKGDFTYNILFSSTTEQASGIVIGVPVKNMAKVPVDYDHFPGISKKELNGEECYTSSAFFFKSSNRHNEIWLENTATRYMKIPVYADLVVSETNYTEQKCIPTMADPHYYMIDSTTDCSRIYPWFLIRRGEWIVGIGFQVFGTPTTSSKRTWYEELTDDILRQSIPKAPRCLREYYKKYDVISIHTWFIKNPWDIKCSEQYLPDNENQSGSEDQSGNDNKPGSGNKPGDGNQPGYGHNSGNENRPGSGHNSGGENQSGYGHNSGGENRPGYGHNSGNENRPGSGHNSGGENQSGYGHNSGGENRPGYGHNSGNENRPGSGHNSGGENQPGYGHNSGGGNQSGYGHNSGSENQSGYGHNSGGENQSGYGHNSSGENRPGYGHHSGGEKEPGTGMSSHKPSLSCRKH